MRKVQNPVCDISRPGGATTVQLCAATWIFLCLLSLGLAKMPVSSEQDAVGGGVGGGASCVSCVGGLSRVGLPADARGVQVHGVQTPLRASRSPLFIKLQNEAARGGGGWPSVKQAGGGDSALCQGRRLKAPVQDETDLGLTCTRCRWRAKYRPK